MAVPPLASGRQLQQKETQQSLLSHNVARLAAFGEVNPHRSCWAGLQQTFRG
jgi:hypothetical protein